MPVPVIGEISAGTPLLAEENKIGEIPVVEEKYNKDLFALKVSGDSMVDAGIHSGDIVVVDKNIEPKNRDIGAFMINGTEATVKSFFETHSAISLSSGPEFPIHVVHP